MAAWCSTEATEAECYTDAYSSWSSRSSRWSQASSHRTLHRLGIDTHTEADLDSPRLTEIPPSNCSSVALLHQTVSGLPTAPASNGLGPVEPIAAPCFLPCQYRPASDLGAQAVNNGKRGVRGVQGEESGARIQESGGASRGACLACEAVVSNGLGCGTGVSWL